MSLLPVEDALARLLGGALPIAEAEEVLLHDANGRVLAADLAARLTQPPFNASAMDGYALRAEDAAEVGAVLTVIGESAAGHAFAGNVGMGEAVRIFTGAPVPEGSDSVLLQEDAEKLDDVRIRTTFPVTHGRHIRPRGQDFAEGDVSLSAGTRLDFSHLTLAAAMNHSRLTVFRRPRIAILATGDELVSPGTVPGPSQIIGSNTFGIAALARDNGADVIDLGIVPDDRPTLLSTVEGARGSGADVLVTLGGASVGDHDLVQSTLISAGMELDFWRIAMRPGKPLMVGKLGDMQVLGLPGNPISSLVCGLLFLEPLLCRLGHRSPPDRMRQARLTAGLAANDKRQDYVRASLTFGTDGALQVTSFGKQDSSMMRIFSQSDCLIVRPPNAPEVDAGDLVPVMLLRP
ncbi:molybdenum cofactor biosynthesis protein MoaA [Rhizobium sp. Root274]|uniref:molybdopterin molybdotransferase MoeA n=1 Tax=unclassified Rhizobium TaxID=2613769 RepID=UPI0007154A8D|nr:MULTISPECIES: gephyrin-like molybdotransferase Glp [unclassified Rhizobium]KQW27604.1 molybdenum cofactor biosynthesis protein MoaA [Rhizobium sp. Root1240]KRD27843.1 molybdenum cofactor biosynthesis protein MoaA [Rhizobium sp. Root274]